MIGFAFLFDLAFAMYTMILKNPMCLFLRIHLRWNNTFFPAVLLK